MQKFSSRKFIIVCFAICSATIIQMIGSIYKFDANTIIAYFNLLGLLTATYCAGNSAVSIFQNKNNNKVENISE